MLLESWDYYTAFSELELNVSFGVCMILGMPNTVSTVLPKNECAQIGQAAVDSLFTVFLGGLNARVGDEESL